MNGINNNTGGLLSGVDHLRQSITDILTTPIGSRVMRREYGSRLYELVDAPVNKQTLIEIYVSTAEALLKWEPRLNVTKVIAEEVSTTRIVLSIEGEFLPHLEKIKLEGLVL